MIIDSHAHACGPFLKPDKLIEILDNNGVDKLVLVPGEWDSTKSYKIPDIARHFPKHDLIRLTNKLTRPAIQLTNKLNDIMRGNIYVNSVSRLNPDRILQFYWPVLTQKDWYQQLEAAYAAWQFQGLKLHQCWEKFSMDDHRVKQLLNFAKQKELPLFIQLYNYKEVEKFIHHIQNYPTVNFIIGHLFGLELYIKRIPHARNIWFELSPPPLLSVQRILLALNHFGAERLLMGSDCPYGQNNQIINIARINALPCSQEDKKLILGENIFQLLKL